MTLQIKPLSVSLSVVMILMLLTQARAQKKYDSIAYKVGGVADQYSSVKGSIGKFLPAKVKDTLYVNVLNIQYNDPKLTLLKNSLGKKNNILWALKDGVVILKITGKKNASAVYDSMDSSLQSMFAAVNMDGNHLTLKYNP